MEQTIKKILLPTKGVCNLTPDLVCDDGELQDCVGLTFNDSALRPIQNVKKVMDAPLMYDLELVHDIDNISKNYIYISDERTALLSSHNLNSPILLNSKIKTVKAIGNILIVLTEEGLVYFLWNANNNSYESYDSLPTLDIEFSNYRPTSRNKLYDAGDILYALSGFNRFEIKVGQNNAFNDFIIGAYNELKNMVHSAHAFCGPYFVRAAIELYDGTYYHITNPVLMLPAFNRKFIMGSLDSVGKLFYMWMWGQTLAVKLNNSDELLKWKDLIKNVSIFVSQEIEEFVTTGDIPMNAPIPTSAIICNTIGGVDGKYESVNFQRYTDGGGGTYTYLNSAFNTRNRSSVINDLKRTSVFYKICELPLTSEGRVEAKDFMEENTLNNLTTLTRLQKDDFYSFTSIIPNDIETFNRRLNLYGVRRTFFHGFERFLQHYYNKSIGGKDAVVSTTYRITVYIKSRDVKERIVSHEFLTPEIIEHYFYYPDPRAYKADIAMKNGNSYVLRKTIILEECPGLNGAMYIDGFPDGTESNDLLEYEAYTPTTPYTEPEYLNNYLIQSDVDNPWIIFASGYTHVGQGEIVGMAGLTTALSQDAYKVATTIVFTTQGVWALITNKVGEYDNVPPPFSREVCSNPKSITMVDHGVFFVSKRGLMLVDDNGIRCVSEQLRGKNAKDMDSFMEFLQDCRMAYDYRDSQLWLINTNYKYHWIYNIKSGTFSRMNDGNSYTSIVNDYPDTLMQSAGNVFSFIEEDDINTDNGVYSCSFMTRPVKFDSSLRMKSIRELLHLYDINDKASMGITIQASNDCKNWCTVSSLNGRGWKFFRFIYDFYKLKAYDTFSGSVFAISETAFNKLR